MRDILVRGLHALDIVAFDQRLSGLADQHRREFPGQVLGILDAGIGTTRAKWRDLMRGVAHEDHAAMHEALDTAAIEPIDRYPIDPEIAVAPTIFRMRGR